MFSPTEKKILWVCIAVFVAVYLRGLWLDIMDVDASQYASIAMEMLQNGSWLEVQHRGADYLDKPPLLFWVSAASYALFGLGNFAYKLPSFLVAMFGVYALWQFARLYYDKETARNAALIFFSAQALVLICNDVRTDTLLLGFATGAVWQLALYLEKRAWKNLIFAFICIGFAMLAKGPIGLVMPIFAVGTHLVLQRRWKDFLRWEWIVGLGVVSLLLLPMCWGLYHQFDMYPEKTVNDKTGVSGLYFYFWEQSFGRITGENIWKNDTTPLYFVHTYLWAFLPWPILLFGALFHRMKSLFQGSFRLIQGDEAYSLGGFVLTFIALSMSKYKLPHYIFITLPWASILVARFLRELFFKNNNGFKRLWIGLQTLTLVTMIFVGGLLIFYVFPEGGLIWKIAYGVTIVGIIIFIIKGNVHSASRIVLQSLLVAALTNTVVNFYFYPNLFEYQGTAKAMQYASNTSGIDMDNLYLYGRHAHTLDVYGKRIFKDLSSGETLKQKIQNEDTPVYVCTNMDGLNRLESVGFLYKEIRKFPQFQVALLKPAFLNPATRESVLEWIYLVELE